MLSLQDSLCVFFFFFNDTATTEIYTLSLHDALPISFGRSYGDCCRAEQRYQFSKATATLLYCVFHHCIEDRKSTRLNSSHTVISYAVFCLKKKNISTPTHRLS